jgi:CheY-like chemotaxis protein
MDAGLAELLAPEHLQPPPLPRSVAPPPPHLTPPPLPPRTPPPVPAARPGDPTRTLPLKVEPPAVPVEPPAVAAAGSAASAADAFRTILLVDDEPDVRQVLGEHVARAGYTVAEAEDPDGAVKKGTVLAKAGTAFLFIVDLGMPTTGGTSFHGGFEAVRKLAKANVKPPVLLMIESLTTPIQTRAKELGIKSFVFKPGLSKLDPEQFEADLKAFAAKVAADVLPRLARQAAEQAAAPAPVAAPVSPSSAAPPKPVAAAAPTKPAVAPAKPAAVPAPPAAPAHVAATADELSRELAMLGQRLDELRRPQDPTQIAALVMGVAKEFFERSVLFLVKGDELRGVNGFGPTARGDALNLLARELVIPLTERSIFSDVAKARRGFTGLLPVSALTTDLLDSIGRLNGGDAALLPLVTHRETIAVLYGDNPESGRPPGRLDGLRLFINQAGIALENAILHRKVHALTGQE